MDDRQSSKLFSITAIAIFAGVVGSVLTLVVSSYFSEFSPTIAEASRNSSVEKTLELAVSDERVIQANTDVADPDSLLKELELALAEASAERSQLAKVLADVTRRIDVLEEELKGTSTELAQGHEFLPTGSEALPLPNDENHNRRPTRERTVQNLIAAGLDSQTADDIQARRDQYQLARLELYDKATREGWIDSDDFSERLSSLNDERVNLREELGESAYDQYLYETGGNNRVGIDSVINGSAAQTAGLQTGDIVLSYAGERVFSTRELQRATRAGSRGEYVQVSFQRVGQYLSADLPRGPLGVTLRGSRVEP